MAYSLSCQMKIFLAVPRHKFTQSCHLGVEEGLETETEVGSLRTPPAVPPTLTSTCGVDEIVLGDVGVGELTSSSLAEP